MEDKNTVNKAHNGANQLPCSTVINHGDFKVVHAQKVQLLHMASLLLCECKQFENRPCSPTIAIVHHLLLSSSKPS